MIDPRRMVGKRLLVGVELLDEKDRVVARRQFLGTVLKAGPEGIVVRESASDVHLLPPSVRVFPAKPGEYLLFSTGEVVADPDFVARWPVRRDD